MESILQKPSSKFQGFRFQVSGVRTLSSKPFLALSPFPLSSQIRNPKCEMSPSRRLSASPPRPPARCPLPSPCFFKIRNPQFAIRNYLPMPHAPCPLSPSLRVPASPRRPPARCLLSSASYGTSRARFSIHLTTTPSSLRAGINLAPTKRGGLSVVGAGFTPTRIGC
jgi:hypothetical protein